MLQTTTTRPKILLLEDEASIRNSLSHLFKESGYESLAVENGEKGVKALRNFYPDIIVSDLLMPKMGGMEFLKYIRMNSAYSSLPFIILTCLSESKDKIDGLEMGADDYITKPFEAKELMLRIRNILKFRQSGQRPLGNPTTDHEGPKSRAFLKNLTDYIITNVMEADLNLKKVSSDLNMSESGLQKKIKRITDKAFTQYVRETRLEHAKSLLEMGTFNVNEAAERSGFRNVSYFSDAFRKYFGYPPSHLIK
ncbi:MAG: response regulator [Bacteroidota bacterium]